jgi:ketosteroid isomerase-like protein
MLDLYTDDAVFDVSNVFADVAPLRGHEEIRRYWRTLRETWDGLRFDPLAGYDLGENRVVVDQRMWATGTHSKIEIDQRVAMLYTIRPADQRITSAVLYTDLESAIAAAESRAAESV